jgi:hypothetical protein
MKTLFALLTLLTVSAPAQGLFDAAAASAQKDYDRSQSDLGAVRALIDKEKEPLNRELATIEEQVRKSQEDYAALTEHVRCCFGLWSNSVIRKQHGLTQ